jgi:hypothetical protein
MKEPLLWVMVWSLATATPVEIPSLLSFHQELKSHLASFGNEDRPGPCPLLHLRLWKTCERQDCPSHVPDRKYYF